jgi:small ubiquitin-related modifier
MTGEDGAEVAQTETITVKLVGQGREEMLFKVKKTTKMIKIMESYAGRVGQPITSLRFMFDGTKVSPDSTPKMMVNLQ